MTEPKAKKKPRTGKAPASAAKPKSASKASAQAKAVETPPAPETAGSRLIDERIRSLADWRGATLSELRRLVHEADPAIVEECKWIKPSNPWGVAVWSHEGIVCTGETYKQVVKVTFAHGAALADPHRLFNSSLEGNVRRAIDFRESEAIDADAFKALIQAAVAANLSSAAARPRRKPRSSDRT